MVKNKLGILLFVLTLIVLTSIGGQLYTMNKEVAMIERQVQTQGYYYRQSIELIREELVDTIGGQIRINNAQFDFDTALRQAMENVQSSLEKVIANTCPIDLPDAKNIRASNVLIVNISAGTLGSGTHLRIKNQDYILTAGHMVHQDDDIIMAKGNNDDTYVLTLMKVKHGTDLALFRIEGACPKLGTLEISDIAPDAGSCVTAIGNPGGDVGVITTGVLSKIEPLFYKVDNTCYFGNSGGALIYKGKVIGVCSQVDIKMQFPVVVIYTEFVKLPIIKDFLRDFTERG
jgi:S1-C subfamily serine protease